jgi:hypothetical protein
MKKIIFILVFASFFIGCNKSNDDFSAKLIGEWSWIKSFGGIGGFYSTPGTTNKNSRISFTNNSIYYLYVNDSLKITHNYITYQVVTKLKSTMVNIVEFDEFGSQHSFSVSHDTLILHDYNMSDGYTSYYKRIK